MDVETCLNVSSKKSFIALLLSGELNVIYGIPVLIHLIPHIGILVSF
ncbi:MAG: hypothetical protein AAGU07_02310 [Methanobacterium sp.]